MEPSQLIDELSYKAVRSSGSGGQNVNKVATKVELYFDIKNSEILDDFKKKKLLEFFSNRINKNGILILSCSETRSQLKNKAIVTQRFFYLISEALKDKKKRISTKIPKALRQKRLNDKRRNSEKKSNRKPPRLN